MLCVLHGYEFKRFAPRANNLQPELKQLSVVLTTIDTTKQGVSRAECIAAIGDDYATCAVGHEFDLCFCFFYTVRLDVFRERLI